MSQIEHKIVEDLESLKYPTELLDFLPGNPRRGHVESVIKSLDQFGQRKPIVARKLEDSDRGVVLAGNTTLRGAKQLNWTHIAVTWVEDDDKTAAAFAIADNRTHDLGEMDDEALVEMVATFDDDYDLLDASGYDLMDVEDIVARISGEEVEIPDLGDDDVAEVEDNAGDKPAPKPVIQYALIFDNEDQQQRWYAFVRWLKASYPEQDTIAERLDEYITGILEL